MPVAKTNPRRAVLVGLAAIVFAAGLIAVVLVANGSGGGNHSSTFDSLRVEDLLERQQSDHVPTCFNDPVSGNRPICVFHTGPNRNSGWVAYDAQVDNCALEFGRGSTELTDPCTGTKYPFTGEGLPQYDVRVDDGRLSIALVEDDDPSTTTTRSG